MFSSEASGTQLRRHLRRFLRARTEARQRLLFRYYDPRTLRTYLPACGTRESADFFGPIAAFAVPGEGGEPRCSCPLEGVRKAQDRRGEMAGRGLLPLRRQHRNSLHQEGQRPEGVTDNAFEQAPAADAFQKVSVFRRKQV